MNFVFWIQDAVLALTAFFIWRYTKATESYTKETKCLREEMVRQNAIALRPVVVLIFVQDAAHRRSLQVRNIGQGAAFNVRIQPLYITADKQCEIQFDEIHWLGSQETREVSYRVPDTNLFVQGDYGHTFFPQQTKAERHISVLFGDVEGAKYRQDLTINPRESQSDKEGRVIYGEIQRVT